MTSKLSEKSEQNKSLPNPLQPGGLLSPDVQRMIAASPSGRAHAARQAQQREAARAKREQAAEEVRAQRDLEQRKVQALERLAAALQNGELPKRAPEVAPPAQRPAPVLELVPFPRGGGSEIMTLSEAAKYLKVSEPTVRKAVREDGLPYIPVGKQYRFRRSDVERWLSKEQAHGRRRP